MEKNDETLTEEEIWERLYAFVLKEMKAGADKATISEKLTEMGVDKDDANKLVEVVYTGILEAAKEEQVTGGSIAPALFGGGLAAVIGGGIWGLIVIGTGYVIGFMAWGMGWLSGFAVLLFSGGRRGIHLQIIAVLSSILGILVGKYIIFYHLLKEAVAKEYGAGVASTVTLFSERVIRIFIEGIGSMVGGFDILWVILAVITAWRIPKGIGLKLRQ